MTLLNESQVREKLGNTSRSTLYKYRRASEFPLPVKIENEGRNLWEEEDINAWLRARAVKQAM
jgi:predicted DNA-binding transcriptional regulator AlpA